MVTGREGFCNIVRATLTEQDVKEKRKNAEAAKCSGLISRTHRSMSMEPGEEGAGAHTGVDSIPPIMSTWNLKMGPYGE